jgi:hypothetical protein
LCLQQTDDHRPASLRYASLRDAPQRFLYEDPMTNRTFESLPENVARMQKILDYLDTRKPGDVVTWVELEKTTSIPMRAGPVAGVRGRDLTRRALRRARREVETIVDVGFRLSSVEGVFAILGERHQRAIGALKRARKASVNLDEAHGAQLSPLACDRLTRYGALFTTIFSLSSDGRKQLK